MERQQRPLGTRAADVELLTGPELAGVGRRLAAYLLDMPLVLLAQAVTGFTATALGAVAWLLLAGGQEGIVADVAVAMVWLVIALTGYGYFAAFEASGWQATPGKRLLGLTVARVDGRPLDLRRAAVRSLARSLCHLSLGLGYLLALSNRRRQGLHDLIAKTVVVRRRS